MKDQQEEKREKTFNKKCKEEAKDRNEAFHKLDVVRTEHYDTTQAKYKTLDNVAHKAGLEHCHAVDQSYIVKKEKMMEEAEKAHERAVRDETHWIERRNSLMKRCDREATEALKDLQTITEDINEKTV